MPKFAANLTFLFTELEPLARIRAAADAGFRAVEIQDPYSLPIGDLRDALTEAG
ncbi:MAG: hydroxypyruvate isomerase, partial [Rhodospirillales bacterium]|nr:hydroxypyruvate isomerase [Rhodospirillales bacterium]